jgi:hypothetical protein
MVGRFTSTFAVSAVLNTTEVYRVRALVFNATFNNISVISWWRKLEYSEKTIKL